MNTSGQEIDGLVVAITGASSGMGAVTARRLAARGARVVIGARREDALARIVAEIEDGGGHAVACPVDVTRPEDSVRLVDRAVQEFGRLDVLIANAGVATVAPLRDGVLDDWNAMIDVNLRGVLHGITAALPVFTVQGSGDFVTVTSTAAAKWVPGQGVYAATKAGVRALCEVLRQEVGPQIRATMICPGATDTEFTTDPDLRARMSAIAMAPDAVADAIVYALSQPASVDVGEIVVRSAAQP
ncbi:SDR family oxidoreductase [Tersicoccus sp. MR15.9]|uniref:SDR family oxidoreductase n=1 Tax=Tersicoccus mangrovi TaxID=3121635 RepID=UPI002FE523C6